MGVVHILYLTLLTFQAIKAWTPGESQPHIVFVFADDLGIVHAKL